MTIGDADVMLGASATVGRRVYGDRWKADVTEWFCDETLACCRRLFVVTYNNANHNLKKARNHNAIRD